jgi:hypothetical protein
MAAGEEVELEDMGAADKSGTDRFLNSIIASGYTYIEARTEEAGPGAQRLQGAEASGIPNS